jgi:hypothetical protein
MSIDRRISAGAVPLVGGPGTTLFSRKDVSRM